MINIKELMDKISALKDFKIQINTAIRDEQEAQRIYDKMIITADKAGARADSRQIREIINQERVHETRFSDMLKNTEVSIAEFERSVKDEQRRKEEVERKLKEIKDRYVKSIEKMGGVEGYIGKVAGRFR